MFNMRYFSVKAEYLCNPISFTMMNKDTHNMFIEHINYNMPCLIRNDYIENISGKYNVHIKLMNVLYAKE